MILVPSFRRLECTLARKHSKVDRVGWQEHELKAVSITEGHGAEQDRLPLVDRVHQPSPSSKVTTVSQK